MTGQREHELYRIGEVRLVFVHRMSKPIPLQRRRLVRLLQCVVTALLCAGVAVSAFAAGPDTAGGKPAVPGPSDARALRTAPSLTTEQVGAGPSIGSRPTITSEPSSTAQPGAPAKDEGIVETVHESVSYGFLATATWLDSFFGDQRYEAESNESQFKVDFDAFREGTTRMDFRKPTYSLRLVLPQLRKKTRLEISGDPTVDPNAIASSTPPVNAVPPTEPTTTKHVGTSLQYFPVESNRSSFSIRAGAKLNITKISVLAGPRYRYLIPLDPWDLRFTEEVIWSSDKRWQSRTTFDLERPMAGGLFFRTTLEGLWTENVNGYPYALAFTLAQPLDPDRALVYSWINSFQTSPTDELVQELFVVSYRQRFWKPWLFLEIDPQIRFPRDKGFTYTPGILFRLELVFGRSANLF